MWQITAECRSRARERYLLPKEHSGRKIVSQPESLGERAIPVEVSGIDCQ